MGPDAKLSKANIKMMTKHLRHGHTPWTGGFDAVTSHSRKIDPDLDMGDPLP
jgi:hypothetical protein